MKPRTLPVKWTTEDFLIITAQWPGRDWARPRLEPLGHSVEADRRDADLMYWLSGMTEKYYYSSAQMPVGCFVPLAHVWVSLDPDWPAGHHVIDLT